MASSIFEQLDFSGLFRDFPQETKQQLADISTTLSCTDGQMIYQNGDGPDALYLSLIHISEPTRPY